MASRIVVLALMVVLALGDWTFAQPTPTPCAKDTEADRTKCIDAAFNELGTANSAGVSAELLQIVGQIVVDRATQAGWSILHDKVTSSLDCNDSKKKTTYPRTCKVLDNLLMQDLLASPRVLLDAAIADFGEIFRGKLQAKMAASKSFGYAVKLVVGIGGVMALWSTHNKDGAFDAVLERARDEIRTAAAKGCPADSTNLPIDLASARAAYGVAMCIVNASNSRDSVKKRLETCDLSVQLANCGKDDDATMSAAIALKNALSSSKAVDGVEGVLRFVTNGAAAKQRETKDADCFATDDSAQTTNLCAEMIEDVGDVGVGLARQDWTMIASGALALLKDYGKLKGEAISGTRFFKLVAAIGQYALTYKSEDASVNEGATQARREIIESLVKQMVDRDERTGWVVSVGGAFGAGLMHRKEFDGSTEGTSNFALPIGIGIQHYPRSSPVGFHAQLGVFDLGQYVTFEDNHEATVGTPDAKAAIAFSATLGLWTPCLSKSIPLFIAAYGGVAPFVLANGKSEYFVGGIVGAYVPLLDF